MTKRAMIVLGATPAKTVKAIEKAGGTVLANYGQSALVSAEEDVLEGLAGKGMRMRELGPKGEATVGPHRVAMARAAMSAADISGAAPGSRHYLVDLAGPIHADWKATLERSGVRVIESQGEDVYLCEIEGRRLAEVQGLAFVDSVVAYHPSLKVSPELITAKVQSALRAPAGITLSAEGRPAQTKPEISTVAGPQGKGPQDQVELVLFDERDMAAAVEGVRTSGATLMETGRAKLVVKTKPEQVASLAEIPAVRQVNPFQPRKLHNNVASGFIHSDVLLNTHGLNGAGQIVGIADTGLDTGVNDATMLDDFEGRIVNIVALGRPGDASDTDGHGTHVAGSVLGDGANSNQTIRGMAPAAQVFFQSILDNAGGLGGIPANTGDLFTAARDAGARIHTNSWGADVNGNYNADSTEVDTFCFNNREFLVLFSAGNDAPNRVGAPGSAKNVLTVGASESVRPLAASVSFPASPSFPTGATLNNLSQQADNQNQVAGFSSIGPAQNNRRKPDVVAPGSWILSTRSSVSVYDCGPDGLGESQVGPGGTGDEDGVATHPEAVGLGLPGGPIFFAGDQNAPAAPVGAGPAAATNYMYLNGTSMATPITAGACTQLRQYLIEQRGHTPSGALMKAIMVNGAVDMGMGVPHTGQGWGRIDMTNALFPPGTNRVQFDDSLDNAVATGDIRTYQVMVSGPDALAVTLAWRDRQGATLQNRLHLRVIRDATGDTFTSDAIGDIRNNVQKVIVAAPVAGTYTIEVEGVSVSHAVPELAPALRQDYALVVSNATGFSCNPSDIVQVIDRSGSMGFSGYMTPAKERAKQMIDILQINDHAGVVQFNSAAATIFPLTAVTDQSVKNNAHTAIDAVSSTGLTDLREGLDQGVTTLGADAGRPRAIVYLSDGFHTVATPNIDNPQLDAIAAAGIKVYTIALGPASDIAVLDNIASRTGTGAVRMVESAADLHKLHEIYYGILGGVGCGGVIHLDSATAAPGDLTQSAVVDATAREAIFALSWHNVTSKLELRLQDPGGAVIQPSSGFFHFAGSTHRYYRIPKPKPGVWKLIAHNGSDVSEPVTLAGLSDSDVRCRFILDPKFLFDRKLLFLMEATFAGRPVKDAKITAAVTFPTVSIAAAIKKFRRQLSAIRVPTDKLGKDKPDMDKLKLDLLATKMAAQGRDVFSRKTVKVALTDDGRDKDPKKDDGIYTAFFDPIAAGVAGPMTIKVEFVAKGPRFGTHRCIHLLPVFVPDSRN
ncbi:MAG: S8 family serine peptidase [Bryobacterales bacterium]|nr:S8 family serine peptidase [Bryobacterales bacterium]